MLEWLSWRGRVRRRRYWQSYVLPIAVLAGLLGNALGRLASATPATVALLLAMAAPIIWLHAVGAIRRLHDCGFSGWWYVLWWAALIADEIAGGVQMLWLLDALALGLIPFALGIWPGTRGPNRFGPDPRHDQPGSLLASPW